MRATEFMLSLASDYYNYNKNTFDRTRTYGASIGHPEIDTLWHALIDLWKQFGRKQIDEAVYAGCLELISDAYTNVWRELCTQERFDCD